MMNGASRLRHSPAASVDGVTLVAVVLLEQRVLTLDADVQDVVASQQVCRKLRLATFLNDLSSDALQMRLFVENRKSVKACRSTDRLNSYMGVRYSLFQSTRLTPFNFDMDPT